MPKIKKVIFVSFFLCFSTYSQNFSWETKILYQGISESGQYPSLVVDSSGRWHIFYWHPDENRLYHGMFSYLLEKPVWRLVDSLEYGGYPHKAYVARDGKLYVAYMVDQGGEMALRLAEWDGIKWRIERNLTTQSFGPYGPYQRFVYPYSQPSIAIGTAQNDSLFITAFVANPTYNNVTDCYDYSPPLVVLKGAMGWISFYLGSSYSTFNGSQCKIERYGEWITYLPSISNMPQLYCVAQRNGELWRFTATDIYGLMWQRDSLFLDSLTHYFPGISSALREAMTFDGLSLMRTPDSVTHLFYSTSDYYGANLGGGGKWGLIHLRITPSDSFIYSFIHAFDTLHYSNTSCAYYNQETLYVTYSVPALGQYRVAISYDGGQNWDIDTLYTTTTAIMNAPIQLKQDTVAVLCYDSKYDRLFLFWQRVGDTTWNTKVLTTSSKPGYYLSAGWTQWDSLNRIYHTAYFDPAKHYLMFQTWHNDSLVNAWRFDDTTKTYSDISVFSRDSNLCFVYVDDVTNRVKLSNKVGSTWTTEVVDFSVRGISPQVVVDSALGYHIVFTDVTNGALRYAMKPKLGAWNYQNLDTVGVITGLFPQLRLDSNDTLHVLYAQMDSNALYYIKGKNGFWEKERVGDSLSVSFVYSLALFHDQPYVVFKEEGTNVLHFTWKDTITKEWKREPISFLPQGNITNRIWLRFDSYGHPWILYAYQNILSGVGIITRIDSVWTSIPIPNPNQIGEDVWFDLPNNYLACIGRSSISPAIVLISTKDTIALTPAAVDTFLQTFFTPKIFPNPFSNQIHVKFNSLDHNLIMDLYTIQGKKVPSCVYEYKQGEYILQVNENLVPGYYFLVITLGNRQWVAKLYKQ